MADYYYYYIFASDGAHFSLTPTLEVIRLEYWNKWYIAKTRFFQLHFTCKMYQCIFKIS